MFEDLDSRIRFRDLGVAIFSRVGSLFDVALPFSESLVYICVETRSLGSGSITFLFYDENLLDTDLELIDQ